MTQYVVSLLDLRKGDRVLRVFREYDKAKAFAAKYWNKRKKPPALIGCDENGGRCVLLPGVTGSGELVISVSSDQ